jgi:hypothetical protein
VWSAEVQPNYYVVRDADGQQLLRIWSLVCGQTSWRDHPTNRRAGDCLYLHSTETFQGNRYNGA